MRSRYLGIIFCFLVLQSCILPDPVQSDFAYLDINKNTFTSSISEGSNNHEFPDMWIFQNGQIIGVYELPRLIAINIAQENEQSFQIQAGIRENGINSIPRVYPFIETFEVSLNLEKNEIRELVPQFQYIEQTKFRLIADFEFANRFGFDEDGVDSVRIELSDEFAATGSQSGKIALLPGQQLEEATNLVYRDIPQDGKPVFVEIDYRGNRDIDIGLIGIEGSVISKEYFVSLRADGEWKKAYINLTDLIVASRLDGYQVIVGVDNTDFESEALVYIDNIKLLHL